MNKLKLCSVLLVLASVYSYALQGGPVQPDYMQFEPSQMPDMVSMQTGDFAYSLPLGDVPGPYGNYPLSIAYHAGVTPNQEASWVGLGWILNPGVINRDVRGVPDDQFHGGTLGFIYRYSAMRSWTVNLGWSYGVVSAGMSNSSHGGMGYSATVGPKLEGVVSVGFTVGTDAVGFSAGIGNEYAGVNASLMFSTKDGSPTMSAGGRLGSTVDVSAGVQYTPGQKVSKNVGFGVSSSEMNPQSNMTETNRIGMTISSNGIGVSASQTLRGGDNGKVITSNTTSMSVTNANNSKGNNKTSTAGFALVVPTFVGVFSLGYSQSLYEYHLRSATSDYLYGYMYQAGPAIVADGDNNIAYLPEAMSQYRESNSEFKWNWTIKGRTLETVGRNNLAPAYDMYTVSSEGLSGTFRPFARENHNIYVFHSDFKTAEEGTEDVAEDYTQVLTDSADGFAYVNEFGNEFGDTLKDNSYDYTYWINKTSASPYALYETRFRNGGNRLVYRKNKDARDTIHSGINFIFAGDAGGYFESDTPENVKATKRKSVSSLLLSKQMGDYRYALYGSRKIEPILEDDSPVGKIKGFVVTKSDGAKYFFTQPVRSYLKIDYSVNAEKGVPVFIDKNGDASENIVISFLKGLGETALGVGKRWIDNITRFSIFGIDQWKETFSGESVKNICNGVDKDGKSEDSYFFSYNVNTNPFATQWLITEIQGADFVKLDENNIEKNIGYNVKFGYTKPQIYRWRTPFARPDIMPEDLPNSRVPKNGYTPEGCDTRMYQAAMGVKEYVYLDSIETSTHKVKFILNDAKNEKRVDGKGFMPKSISEEKDQHNEIPIFVHASLGLNLKYQTKLEGLSTIAYKYKTSDGWLYVNSEIPEPVIDNMKKSGYVEIMGVEDTGENPFKDPSKKPSTTKIYGFDGKTIKVKIDANVKQVEKTTGVDTKNGLFRIKVTLNDEKTLMKFVNDANNSFANDRLLTVGENGEYVQNLYINWGNIVWNRDPENDAENSMRYLKRIEFYKKNVANPYKKYEFAYDYSLQPKTLNSYCDNLYPKTNDDIVNSPDSVGLNVCSENLDKNYLYGKLTLKGITEYGCQGEHCVSLPPFKFEYNSPSETSTRLSSKDGWTTLAKGITEGSTNVKQVYPEDYYQDITDVDASILATNNSVDEWGFWEYHATEENHKTNQKLADYSAAAWSLNKVVDPAGGVLEVEYERDVYSNGEDYGDDNKYVPVVEFNECSEYKNYGTIRDVWKKNLCVVVQKLYWRERCLGPKAEFWDSAKPVGYDGNGFEYLEILGIRPDEHKNLYFNFTSTVNTTVDCGLWSSCDRPRSAAVVADGRVSDILDRTDGETKLIVLDRKYATIHDAFIIAANKINPNYDWDVVDKSRGGFMWAADHQETMKGGDIRVTKLRRHDIDRTAETSYNYGVGELALLPDSAYNAVLANRYYTSKVIYALPDLTMQPMSRIVGFNDDDLDYIPGSKITYPIVSVKNTTKGDTSRVNGRTEFKYITPETGVPEDFVDPETAKLLKPFLKVDAQLMYWGDKSQEMTYRAYKVCYELFGSAGARIDKERCVPMLQNEHKSVYFYADNIKDAKSLNIKVSVNPTTFYSKAYSLTDPLHKFNELSISIDAQFGKGTLDIYKKWLRTQKEGYFPILYKHVEYAQTREDYTLQGIEDSDVDEEEVSLDLEKKVTYHDFTAFLGLNYKTTFYRGNQNEIVIKADSTVYRTMATDVLENVVAEDVTDVQKKIGRQVEHWNVENRLSCDDDNKGSGKENVCEKNYPDLYEKNDKKTSSSVSYIRYPVFLISSISMTGYDIADTTNYEAKLTKTELENHGFDPITGSPTATLAKVAAPNGKQERKLTVTVPYYTFGDQDSISKEMFLRNMLRQTYVQEVYTGKTDVNASWDNIKNDAAIRSFTITPYGFMPDGVLKNKALEKKPIIALGEFKPREEPEKLHFSAFNYKNGNDSLPPLTSYTGSYITKIDSFLRIREVEDVLGKTLSTVFSNDGVNQISLFYPATTEEIAVVLPYEQSVSTENCKTYGDAIVDAKYGYISGLTSISCSLKEGRKYVAEYRKLSGDGWKTYRENVDGSDFSMTLSSADKLNYLRIYPENAEAKSYIYDIYGMMIQNISETNLSTYYVYDSFGKLVESYNDDGLTFKSHHRELMNGVNNVEVNNAGK